MWPSLEATASTPSYKAMPAYHAEAPAVRPPFVNVAYLPDLDGRWAPASLPDRCPLSLEKPAIACRVRVDHQRERKTGHCSPLTVARCRPHRRSFTLYPCGFAPHGRVPIAAVDPRGTQILAPSGQPGLEAAWRGTPFEAALDAAQGVAWPRTGAGSRRDGRWWRTQGRWLALEATVLGIAVLAAGRVAIAAGLEVPALALQDAALAYQEARGYRMRGAAILSVLSVLPPSLQIAGRLLGSGALSGRWGTPLAWDASIGRLRSCAFRTSGVPP